MSNFFTPEFNNESAIAPWNASLQPNKAIMPQLEANRLLTGGIGQEVNIPTLTPEAYDNIILPDASLTRMASGASTESNTSLPDSSVDLLTGQAMSEVYGDLSKFAADPDFAAKLNVPFGENWDTAAAKALAEAWFKGDFSDISPVKVVSSAEIAGANGAFAVATDTIYLSKEFLAGNGANPAAVADVLLEEIGHSVDARLNVADSPGDEGAIFSRVVQGKELSQQDILSLKSENDQLTLMLDNQMLDLELATILGKWSRPNSYTASEISGIDTEFVQKDIIQEYGRWRTGVKLELNGIPFSPRSGQVNKGEIVDFKLTVDINNRSGVFGTYGAYTTLGFPQEDLTRKRVTEAEGLNSWLYTINGDFVNVEPWQLEIDENKGAGFTVEKLSVGLGLGTPSATSNLGMEFKYNKPEYKNFFEVEYYDSIYDKKLNTTIDWVKINSRINLSNDNAKFYGNERLTLRGKIKVKEVNEDWLYIGFRTQPIYSADGIAVSADRGDFPQSAKEISLFAAASIRRSLSSNIDFG